MILHTEHLGDIEYVESDVIHFPEGLPGFEDEKSFIIIPSGDLEFPFSTLQSTQDEKLAFIITDPFLFVEPYDFEMADSDTKKLGIEDEKDLEFVLAFTMVTIPENVEETTINIMAPVIINTDKQIGKQILLNEYDDVKFSIFKKNSEV